MSDTNNSQSSVCHTDKARRTSDGECARKDTTLKKARGSSDVLVVKCGVTGLWGGKTSNRISLQACLRVGSVI